MILTQIQRAQRVQRVALERALLLFHQELQDMYCLDSKNLVGSTKDCKIQQYLHLVESFVFNTEIRKCEFLKYRMWAKDFLFEKDHE